MYRNTPDLGPLAYNDDEVTIVGDKVVVPVKGKPAAVYYGWAPYTDANLVNEDELPASTFKLKMP
ncbi:MAG TPA: hypothetical protein VHD83_22330 [Puia sp.]|nr:hypothetical protein [Puia sp.]